MLQLKNIKMRAVDSKAECKAKSLPFFNRLRKNFIAKFSRKVEDSTPQSNHFNSSFL